MGLISWKTSDTKESISCVDSIRGTFPVALILPDNTRYIEESYEGYGEFGGKDIYEVIAELDGKKGRDEGIDMVFDKNPSGNFYEVRHLRLPKLARNVNARWEDLGYPETCEYQGFFYD